MTDEKLIKAIVDQMKLPQEVKSVDFSFSEDSTGMPAVWINLHVSQDYKPSKEKVNLLSALKKEISKKVFENNVISWPYVRLVTD